MTTHAQNFFPLSQLGTSPEEAYSSVYHETRGRAWLRKDEAIRRQLESALAAFLGEPTLTMTANLNPSSPPLQ